MGILRRRVGARAGEAIPEKQTNEMLVALAGNPNVGKSTVFNALTGLHQHTGNWTGKTVATATGVCQRGTQGERYRLVDLPGTYSLAAHSEEEEVARDFLCFGGADAVVVVCDAGRLRRNLPLFLQITEITPHVLLCLNLMDEAARAGITVDAGALEAALGVPVVTTSAGRGRDGDVEKIMDRLPEVKAAVPPPLRYGEAFERAIAEVETAIEPLCGAKISPRFAAMKLILGDGAFRERANAECDNGFETTAVREALASADRILVTARKDGTLLDAEVTATLFARASSLADMAVRVAEKSEREELSRADRVLMSGKFGIPVLLLMLAGIFWLTVVGANAPSTWLSQGFSALEPYLYTFLTRAGLSVFWTELITYGLYRVPAWIISVMLPPMAIFFPLFTLMEDVGYLPRVAFHLDGMFSRCEACGKQALTMCMGLGCNAAGVVGTRIIDSRRERLIATLTNCFMPCNGRFPGIITIATLFFVGAGVGSTVSSMVGALVCAVAILVGVGATLIASKLLSKTILRGESSSFVLELPPYRRPQIGKILVRSLLDRTIFVLGRAIAVAAPAGVLIYLFSHLTVGGVTVVALARSFLDPFGRVLGLDGAILLAFLLGLPASEIVLPLCFMIYLSNGALAGIGDIGALRDVLIANGWTVSTAICFLLFSVMHWPCATTLMTIHKETGRVRYVILGAALPTLFGVVACFLVHGVSMLFH